MFGLWERAAPIEIVEPDEAKRLALRDELDRLGIACIAKSKAASRKGDAERARVFRGLAVVAALYTKELTP